MMTLERGFSGETQRTSNPVLKERERQYELKRSQENARTLDYILGEKALSEAEVNNLMKRQGIRE